MRPLVVTLMQSLDGVIDSPGGGDHPRAGWSFQDVAFEEAAYELKGREQEEAAAMLLGAQSYREFAPVWPSMTDEFPQYNAMPKFVVSSTLQESDLTWGPAHLLRSLDDVARLRAGEPVDGAEEMGEGTVIVHGSADLVAGLAAADLVDRYHLLTFPVVLGAGKRFLGGDVVASKLAVREQQTYANGVTMGVYDVVR